MDYLNSSIILEPTIHFTEFSQTKLLPSSFTEEAQQAFLLGHQCGLRRLASHQMNNEWYITLCLR